MTQSPRKLAYIAVLSDRKAPGQFLRMKKFEPTMRGRDLGFIPRPKRLDYGPNNVTGFGWTQKLVFSFSITLVVGNLFYCQPLLIELSRSFDVSYADVSIVATLLQAGYAVGLLFIAPMGDLVRRRQLIILLVILSTCFTIPLAVTSSFTVFAIFSFLVGMTSVTPQILIPLGVDLTPPEERATSIAMLYAGISMGGLLARVVSGVIGEFADWRAVYYMAIAVQLLILVGLYFLIPDYPPTIHDGEMSYLKILWTMGKFLFTEPILAQASIIQFASSAALQNFWVTSTFLLGDDPYNYSTFVIGLFGLIGMFTIMISPFLGRILDKLVPWYAALSAVIGGAIFQGIQCGAGGLHIVAVITVMLGVDFFRPVLLVSLSASVFSIKPEARSRLNSVLILSLFLGSITGTSLGSIVFTSYGWRAGAALSLGFFGIQLICLVARGPNCDRGRWLGWQGGLGGVRKAKVKPDIESPVTVVERDLHSVSEKASKLST